jgi:hypothetical protein
MNALVLIRRTILSVLLAAFSLHTQNTAAPAPTTRPAALNPHLE